MTGRRLAYFTVGILGGLSAGAGGVLEWQAVNFGGVRKIHGTDTAAGVAILSMAVAVIVVTLLTRKGSTDEPRSWGAPVNLVLGAAITVGGVMAASGAAIVYDPSRNSEAQRLAAATGTTSQEILKIWEEATGVHTGAGPWVVLAGGAAVVIASAIGFAWTREWKRASGVEGAGAAAGRPDPG